MADKLLNVDEARRWLRRLVEAVGSNQAGSARSFALSRILAMHDAKNEWDEGHGRLTHALVVLAFDKNLRFDPDHGSATLIPRLAMPGLPKQTSSEWAKILRALITEDLTVAQATEFGIRGSLTFLKTGINPLKVGGGANQKRGSRAVAGIVWTGIAAG
jgi:hypothetical protein